MDELVDILRRIKADAIDGTRSGREAKMRRRDKIADMSGAIKAAVLLLSDGLWHEATRVRAISKIYAVDYGTLLDKVGIAVSDSGHYVCIEMTDTPEAAPDEE